MVPLLHVFISLLMATSILAKALAGGDAAFDADGWYVEEADADDVLNVSSTMPTCNGRLGECNEDEEMAMESETSRRILANRRRRRHISYDALKKNRVPCGQRGASYYDCYGHVQVNPYRRACTMITHCARILD